MIRVVLPTQLQTLAGVDGDVELELERPTTARAVLGALEARYPTLRGTILDPATQERRPFLRFFVGERDLSHQPLDAALPEAVTSGAEPFWILAAIVGG